MDIESLKKKTEEMRAHRERMCHAFTRGEVIDYLRMMPEFIEPGVDPLKFAIGIFERIKATEETT